MARLSELVLDPLTTPVELANNYVTGYSETVGISPLAALSAADLSCMPDVLEKLGAFSDALEGAPDGYETAMRVLRSAEGTNPPAEFESDFLYAPIFTSLSNFAYVVSQISNDTLVVGAAQDLCNSLSEMVFANITGDGKPYSGGLNIFMPHKENWWSLWRSDYIYTLNTVGLNASTWDMFLDNFYDFRNSAVMPIFDVIQLTQSVCSFSENGSIVFEASATGSDVYRIEARVYTEGAEPDEANVWHVEFYNFSTPLPNGQRNYYSEEWLQTNEFSWDGTVWSLSNGTHIASGAVEAENDFVGKIEGYLVYPGGLVENFRIFFNLETGGVYALFLSDLSGETSRFYEDFTILTDGTVLYPYSWYRTPDGLEKTAIGGSVTVGGTGLEFGRRALPAGAFQMEIVLRTIDGVEGDTETVEAFLED